MKDLSQLYKKILSSIITKYLPNCAIYLYGSRARGDYGSGSDIDVAIDNKEPVDYQILAQIKYDIYYSLIPVFTDVVDIHAISEELKKNILKDKVVWKS